MSENVALLDLDGTLADYDAAIMRDLKFVASPYELEHLDADYAAEVPYIKARKKLIRSQPGWWTSLEPLKSGFDVVELLKKYGFLLHVLTRAPGSIDAACSEKASWCRKYLPGVDIAITPNKGMVYGKILFDDWPEYIGQWLKYRPRGLVIMPDQKWNKHVEHPQVIRYTGSNLDEVEGRIKLLLNK